MPQDNNITALIEKIIRILQREDVPIGPDAAIDLYKVFVKTGLKADSPLSTLKFVIAPVICRNKEEQEKIYEMLDRADLNKKVVDGPVKPPGGNGEEVEQPPEEKNPFLKAWNRFKRADLKSKAAIIAIMLAAVAYGLYWLSKPAPPPEELHLSYKDPVVIDSLVTIRASINDTSRTKQYQVNWRLPDTSIAGQWQISKVFTSTGSHRVIATLTDRKNNIIAIDTQVLNVLCETPPEVTIIPVSDNALITGAAAANGHGRRPGDKADSSQAATASNKRRIRMEYIPVFRNASADSLQYKYSWYVNDTLKASSREFSYVKTTGSYNTIRLTVNCRGLHCSRDSMPAMLKEAPAITATLLPGPGLPPVPQPLPYHKLLLLLLIPLLLGLFVYRQYKQRLVLLPPKKKPGKKEPHSIVFKEQQHLINAEQEVNKLADVLRKRQTSDMFRLNIHQTIKDTIAYGGLPRLCFTPVTKAVDYLILIDKEYHDSHITRLHEYLLDKLQREQVNIQVYEYYKEPLLLSNEKLHHRNISIDRLATLYEDSVLFILGDSSHFIYPIKGKIKNWVKEKTAAWKTKVFITNYAPADWDKKEKLLQTEGFTTISADISAQTTLDKVLFNQMDNRQHLSLPDFYPARFLNLNSPESIGEYLKDEQLFRWVCALAVYPYTNWNLTIAIGHALEDRLKQEGADTELVTYTHLLKLGRISWMHDTQITHTLRIKLLNLLDNDTEALARSVLLEQLSAIKNVTDDSFIKREYDAHYKLNAFLKKLYYHEKVTAKEKMAVRRLLEKNQVDEGNKVYLEKGTNTLIRSPFRNSKHIGIKGYFRQWKLKMEVIAWLFFALTFLVSLTSMYAVTKNKIYKPATASMTFHVQNHLSGNFPLALEIISGDTVKTIQISAGGSFIIDKIPAKDSTTYGRYTLSNDSAGVFIRDSFRLGIVSCTLLINEPVPVPVSIYYNGAPGRQTASQVEELLPSYFITHLTSAGLADTAFSVLCFDTAYKVQAYQCANIINRAFNTHIAAKDADSSLFKGTTYSIMIIVPVPGVRPTLYPPPPDVTPDRDGEGVVDTAALVAPPNAPRDTPIPYPQQQQQQQLPDSTPKDPKASKFIMWVDDHPEYNRSLIDHFKKLGYFVLTVHSNEQAIVIAEKNYYSGNLDLVISDVGRDKDGTDAGMRLAKLLKSKYSRLPFILYTSAKQEKHFYGDAKAMDLEIANDPNELVRRVTRLLNAANYK